MLTAVTKTGKKYAAFELDVPTGRNTDWYCPLCNTPLDYIQRSVTGTVAHFRHSVETVHPGLSEGHVHNRAKRLLLTNLTRDNAVEHCELERILGEDPLQVADIYLEHADHGPIAVEVQCSPQSVPDFKTRTKYYTDKGIAVLWLVQEETYLPAKETNYVSGTAFKDSVRWLQRHYYGRVYALDADSCTVVPARLTKKSTIKHNERYGDYRYWYDTIGEQTVGSLPNYGLVTDRVNDYRIARFYDKCWWKNEETTGGGNSE